MAEPEDKMAVTVRRHRFTIDEYHWMGRGGLFHEDDRIELIEGEIIEMTPIGRAHAAVVHRIQEFFADRLGRRASVWVQNPLRLPHHHSEPQPDILLLERRADCYANALPEPRDVRLLIEVADSSLAYDRETKFPLYARAGVVEAWLVDVEGRRVEIHREPGADGYGRISAPTGEQTFACLAFPDVAVTLADLLG